MPGGSLVPVSGDEEWQRLLEAQRHLQQAFPDLVLVGGTAAALHAGHRRSLDGDHVVGDLRQHYDEVLRRLEELAGWRTNRARPPVLILGRFEGVETGIRQLRRSAPLETEQIAGITVPTLLEMVRVKAWLVVTRNAVRDYVDLCALAKASGAGYVRALSRLDELYPQDSGESVLRQLCKQLAEPRPYDLAEGQRQLAEYRGVQPPWQDWEHVRAVAQDMAFTLARMIGLDLGVRREPGRSIGDG